jgi:DNA-directed RNA polymerase specialized sigma24 family protein
MTDAVRSALHEPSGRNGGDDLAALHAREIDRLVAYLFSSDRALGLAGAESIAEQAFLELRATWPGTGGYPSHQVHLFATAQRIASTWQRRPQPAGSDPLKDSAPTYWDRADVNRLTVLQDCLDRLPDVPRRVVLLREMCGFTGAQAAQVVSVPESGAENARADGLRALVPMIESGTGAGDARRGPLVPEDFAALARVLQVGDGRVAAARSRFAETLSQPARGGVPAGGPQRPPSAPAPGGLQQSPQAGRPPLGAGPGGRPPMPGGTPQPPAVPPTAAFGTAAASAGPMAGADITRMLPSAGQPQSGTPQPAAPGMVRPGMPQPGMPQPGMPQPGMPQPGMPQPGMIQQGFVQAPPPGAPLTRVQPGLPQSPVPQSPMPPPGPQYTAPPSGIGSPPAYSPSPVPGGFTPGGSLAGPSYSSPSFDSGSLLGGPSSSLVSIGTPIFDSVSAWFSSGGANAWASLGDDAWQEASARAAAQPSIAGNTSSGLPRRRPGANTVPSATETLGRSLFAADPGHIDAGTVRSRLDGFQQGLRNARLLRDNPAEEEEIPQEDLEPEFERTGHANGNTLFGVPGSGPRGSRGAAAPRAASPPRFQPFEAPAGSTSDRAAQVPARRQGGSGAGAPSLPRRPGAGGPSPAGPLTPAPPEPPPSARSSGGSKPLPRRGRPSSQGSGPVPETGRRPSGLPSRQRPDRSTEPGGHGGQPPRPSPSRPSVEPEAGNDGFGQDSAFEPAPGRQAEVPARHPLTSRQRPAPPEPVEPPAPEADHAGDAGRPSETRGFGAFYRDYLPQLLALLMIEGARPAVAADLAQDVMSAAYREWARIEKPREWTRQRALAAWIDRREEEGDEEE